LVVITPTVGIGLFFRGYGVVMGMTPWTAKAVLITCMVKLDVTRCWEEMVKIT